MDTTAQDPASNAALQGNTPPQNTVTQVGTSNVPNIPAPQAVSIPIGGKEAAPVTPSEFIAPSTPEIVPPAEIKEYVQVNPVVPSLPQAAQQAGVQHAKEATLVHTEESASLNLQTSHPTIKTMMGIHKNVKDGITWLLRLINREQEKQTEQKEGV